MLRADEVTYRYPGAERAALTRVSLTVEAGQVVAVAGPNGSGKTTLLRVALGALVPQEGRVELAGREASSWARRALAREVAVVTQREELAFPMRVRDLVLLGRYPRLSPWGGARSEDHEAVDRALARVDATWLVDRWAGTLSGGEWQRVRLARALAQEPRLLALDEPTTSLDVRHEMELFELLVALARQGGLAVVVVTHQLNLAARFADQLVLLAGGRVAAEGTPEQVMREDLLAGVFGWPVEMVRIEGAPQYFPCRRAP